MPHIALPAGLPGITSGFAFRPETARPMTELAEILLRGPSSLTSCEREMIATHVSTRNDCYFCRTSHRAAAANNEGGSYELVSCPGDFDCKANSNRCAYGSDCGCQSREHAPEPEAAVAALGEGACRTLVCRKACPAFAVR